MEDDEEVTGGETGVKGCLSHNVFVVRHGTSWSSVHPATKRTVVWQRLCMGAGVG